METQARAWSEEWTEKFELFPIDNRDLLVLGEKEGKNVFTRGSNRIKSCFGEITGRRIKNGPLRPSLSNKKG